jgi:predicted nucleotidyltransferase component of viral defense system
MKNERYRSQVDLLIRILPHINSEEHFALKGGTAINMFIWDMPRLSVDIDLTYLPFDNREVALSNIANAFVRLQAKIAKAIPGIKVEIVRDSDALEAKLICTLRYDQVKIEVNTIMRGALRPARTLPLSLPVQQEFGKFTEIKVISEGELFGGKICAALDRQHPRDLFDVYQLFKDGNITQEIKEGFIAALLSHNRPMHELLNPNFLNQIDNFSRQFEGMTLKPFTYKDFENTRERLVKEIKSLFTDNDKQLILSFKAGSPNWCLSSIEKLQYLPAVKWKLENILKLAENNPLKHKTLLEALGKVL